MPKSFKVDDRKTKKHKIRELIAEAELDRELDWKVWDYSDYDYDWEPKFDRWS